MKLRSSELRWGEIAGTGAGNGCVAPAPRRLVGKRADKRLPSRTEGQRANEESLMG